MTMRRDGRWRDAAQARVRARARAREYQRAGAIVCHFRKSGQFGVTESVSDHLRRV